MTEGTRQRLVRHRRLRMLPCDGCGGPKRVSQDTLLPQGARLLVPKDISPPAPGLLASSSSPQSSRGESILVEDR
jgi:hypothetical protein